MIRQLAILAVAAIYLTVDGAELPTKASDTKLIYKTVYDLLWHVDQPKEVHPELYKIGTGWDIQANIESYTDKVAVKEFVQRFKYGMLPRGRIFSVFYPDLLDEAVALFRVFYYASDIQTFFKTACWARVHVNEGQFIYAFTIAVLHRPDTKYIRLPLPYETFPDMFFNRDVMQKAFDIKMAYDEHSTSAKPETFIVHANYSNWYATSTHDPETKLNYYLEDVGLNTYYYFVNQEYPVWMPSKEFNLPSKFRGEFYFYVHQWLSSRYYLERLSHDLGEVEYFDWKTPIVTGFTPSLCYRNGMEFPQRREFSTVPSHKYGFLVKVDKYVERIASAIDYGHILTKTDKSEIIYNREGFNFIGDLIQGNADSLHHKFYGSVDYFMRKILGFSPKPYNKYHVVPSALEHFSTSMRDPAFYRMYQRILNYFKWFKEHLPVYTHDQLFVKGVEIESVAVDKLITYFDATDSMISNSVRVHDHADAQSILIKARQYRLNHAPFVYHYTVKSDRKMKASVRAFLGPKYNAYGKALDINENYQNFIEVDYFVTDLEAGTNKIVRRSNQSPYVIPDYESSDVFYKKLLAAIESGSDLPVDKKMFGIPDRLILPKGKKEGMPFQLFFYINEFFEAKTTTFVTRGMGEWIIDDKPFGFPLDRPMFAYNFTMPNMYFKDVLVYHKDEVDVHATV